MIVLKAMVTGHSNDQLDVKLVLVQVIIMSCMITVIACTMCILKCVVLRNHNFEIQAHNILWFNYAKLPTWKYKNRE